MTNIYDTTITYIPSNVTVPDCPDGQCRNEECAKKALDELNEAMGEALQAASDAYNAALAQKATDTAASDQAYIDCLNQPGDLFDFMLDCMEADHDRGEGISDAYRAAKKAVATAFSRDVKAAKDAYKDAMAKCCEDCD